MSPREAFGEYRYTIRKNGQIVAHYWHDYLGDDHGIDFVGGKTILEPLGRVPNFMAGGGLSSNVGRQGKG